MQTRGQLAAACALGLLFILSCGGGQAPPGTVATERYLPAEFPELGLVRDGEILHFAGDSLFNYIDGAAEMYHKYGFVEVHVGKYKRDGGEITVDVYRFAGPDLAFGMYSTLRPEDPDAVALGAEGFAFGPVLVFASDPYMVNVQTYDEDLFAPFEVEALAAAVAENLPGKCSLPLTFDLFPDSGRIPHSERMSAESFLGRRFLTNVYTADYSIESGGGGKATLFLARDEDGSKLSQWLEAAPPEGAGPGLPPDLPYDEGTAALLNERYYGRILVGLVGGRLAGIVGYEPGHEGALREWLRSLPAASDE
jgi:hypothetical protein